MTLHTWPQAYAPGVEDREASKADHGGDKYRAMEMEYICEHTIGTVPEAKDQLWMMMGDFNAPQGWIMRNITILMTIPDFWSTIISSETLLT